MSSRRQRSNPSMGGSLAILGLVVAGVGLLVMRQASAGDAVSAASWSPEMQQIIDAYPASAPVAARIVVLARQLGAQPAWIANVIQFESGWKTTAVNPYSGATGLIQFMPNTAAELGTTTAALKNMSIAEQFNYVEAYFMQRRIPKPLPTQLDVFMAIFYPVAVGKGGGYAFPSSVQKANPGIRTAQDYYNFAMRNAKIK